MAETLGHYTLLEPIGVGALGALHRARDTKTGRTVAVRVIDPAIVAAAGFESLREALQRATTLSHPSLAAIYDVDHDGGRWFYAQEFVPGTTLAAVRDGGPMNVRLAIGYAIEIADGLAEADALQMPHGHLGPSVLMVTPKGHAKILDTGFARWTGAGGQAGTPDIAALSAILAALIAGPGGAARPGVPQALAILLDRTLAKRDESPATFAAALRQIADALDARAADPLPIVAPYSSRSGAGRWMSAVVIVLLLAGAAALIWLAATGS